MYMGIDRRSYDLDSAALNSFLLSLPFLHIKTKAASYLRSEGSSGNHISRQKQPSILTLTFGTLL